MLLQTSDQGSSFRDGRGRKRENRFKVCYEERPNSKKEKKPKVLKLSQVKHNGEDWGEPKPTGEVKGPDRREADHHKKSKDRRKKESARKRGNQILPGTCVEERSIGQDRKDTGGLDRT